MEGARPVGRVRQCGEERVHRITLRFTRSELTALEHRCLHAGGSELAPCLRRILLAPLPGSNEMMEAAASARRDRVSWVGTIDRRADSRQGGVAARRTHMIFVRVNAAELAELERRRMLSGVREMSTYVRTAVLAQRPPQAVVPELNRTAWVALAEHLARMQELADQLESLLRRQRGGLVSVLGRGRLEEVAATCLEELRAQDAAIQALRRNLLGTNGRRQ